MFKLKSIIFTALLCLLFCTTELSALGSNELNSEKQETSFSLDGIVQSLGETVNGLGKALNETVNGLGKSLGETMNGLGDFLEETGEVVEEVAEVAIVAGLVFLYIKADADFYYYDYGHHHGHIHYYHR